MDRIDIIHDISVKFGKDIFYSREGKLRKALNSSALEFQDIEDIVEVCMLDRKYTKTILTEPDLKVTREFQKALVVKYEGKSIQVLKDIHTAIYNSENSSVSMEDGELDDGRFVYSVVSGRKQCLDLVRTLAEPGYEVTIPDTVTIEKKEYKIVSIADKCFEGNTKITSVKLPAGLETIGKNAFCNCSNLSVCELPKHVKSIGDNAFAYSAIETVSFQERLEEVGTMAFYKCRKLKTVSMTKRTSQLGIGAFVGCESLEKIDIEDKNGRFVFENGVLYSRKQDRILAVAGTFKGKLSPPRSLIAIEQYAAEGCTGITEVDLPVSLESIGACAFKDCTSITKTKFPNTLSKIGERAFENCSSLGSFDLPSSVRTIGKMAFRNCSKIEVASIEGVVKYKDLKIFEGCTGLNRITIDKASEYTDADFPKNTRIKFSHH